MLVVSNYIFLNELFYNPCSILLILESIDSYCSIQVIESFKGFIAKHNGSYVYS